MAENTAAAAATAPPRAPETSGPSHVKAPRGDPNKKRGAGISVRVPVSVGSGGTQRLGRGWGWPLPLPGKPRWPHAAEFDRAERPGLRSVRSSLRNAPALHWLQHFL